MTEFQPAITGIGGALGEESLTNAQLIERLGIDSTPERIRDLTLIEHRYWALPETGAADLGYAAAYEALKVAGLSAQEIDGIFATTLTPDHLGPFTATEIHRRLGLRRDAFAHDSVIACSGGVVGLMQAAEKSELNPGKRFMTVATELMSRVVDPTDRKSAILFGDGASAGIVQSVRGAKKPVFVQVTVPDREAINGGTAHDPLRKLHMDGKRVARHALDIMPDVAFQAAEADGAGSRQDGIDWDKYDLFIPHQANGKMIELLWKTLNVPEEKRVLTVDQHGNTSSASVGLALCDAYEKGRVDDHIRLLVTSVAAGMIGAGGAIDACLGQGDQ
jgi:3-oxoacyl-[acyl-carrier-protein] synthase-3